MRIVTTTLALLLALAPSTLAQGRRGPPGGPPGPGLVEAQEDEGIVWFSTLDAGLAEARRSGKAILLVSAAPQCHGTPGVW